MRTKTIWRFYLMLSVAVLLLIASVAALIALETGSTGGVMPARELVAGLGIGVFVFLLLVAVLLKRFPSRRLRKLADAVDAFRQSGFTEPIRLPKTPRTSRGDDVDRLQGIVQEMSERIVSQLREQASMNEQRRELLANVSHDLRTPLASMQGYLETLLLRHGTLSDAEQRNYLEVAAKHSERLGKLVSDLFQLTKLEAHELQPQLEYFSVAEVVQDVVQKYQLAAEQRGLRLDVRFAEQPGPVQADIAMVERVLENLIDNAMRHTGSGGVVRVALGQDDERIFISVSDTGRGIAPDDLPYVFDRYYRASRGEASDAGHSGLGLAITRQIVALHGGTIKVASTLGSGTTFTFDLPLAKAA